MGKVTIQVKNEIGKQLKDDEIAQISLYGYETEEEACAKALELIANRKNGIPRDSKYVDVKKLKKMTAKINKEELKNVFKATKDFSN